MVFAPLAFLEFLEVHEAVVPGVEEEVLLPALPVVRPVLDGAGRKHASHGFQELERDQVEARFVVGALGAAGELLRCASSIPIAMTSGLTSGESKNVNWLKLSALPVNSPRYYTAPSPSESEVEPAKRCPYSV